MNARRWRLLLFALTSATLTGGVTAVAQQASGVVRTLTGPYLGQKPPGTAPEIFAPGIVSTREDEHGFEVAADGNEMVFVRGGAIMLIVRGPDGRWSGPAVAPFSGKHIDGEPCFSPDGRRIYFCSRRPHPRARLASNVWVVDKGSTGWGNPVLVDLPTSRVIHAPSVAANGTIYEDGLVRFTLQNGKYLPAEPLRPPSPGIWPFIAPDESFVLFSVRQQGRWDFDLFVRRRQIDGTWSAALPLGKEVNAPTLMGNPFVTADLRYLFFGSRFDVYWVSAETIPGHIAPAKGP